MQRPLRRCSAMPSQTELVVGIGAISAIILVGGFNARARYSSSKQGGSCGTTAHRVLIAAPLGGFSTFLRPRLIGMERFWSLVADPVCPALLRRGSFLAAASPQSWLHKEHK